MKMTRLMGATALASAAFLFPQIAFAQSSEPVEAAPTSEDTIGAQDATGADSESGTVTITGSRIRQPNIESAIPVTVVTGEELFETGQVSVGDVLNDLPQLRNTFSQQNSTRFLGTRGLNLLDLRGLGTQRTLVLQNGRRHVAGDILSNGTSPDVNTFPTDLIDRVEIVTGGNSAVYGSDAVAGVVNFILKRDFEGLQVRGQAGISDYRDAGNQYVSALAGKNFGDGRGNIALNLEYAHQADYYASGRKNLRRNDAFIVVDTDPASALNGADDVVDRIFYQDLRSSTISLGGQVGIRYPNTAAAPCGRDTTGASFTCGFLFQPDGTLIPQTGLRVGLGPNGNYVGGNGTTSREGKLLALSPDLERISANVLAHYEFSPAADVFLEAKYVRTTAFGSQSGPFFSQGSTLSDNVAVAGLTDYSYFNTGGTIGRVNREGIRLDNPYLSAQARGVLASQLTAAINAGVNPNTGATAASGGFTAAQQAASLAQIAAGTYRFSLRRNYVDLGIRDEEIRRETFRVVGGLRGTFNDDWSYEISANYGEHKENNRIAGNISRQRFVLALDSARNAAGQVVCRSQVDPAYAGGDRAGNPAQLAADIAACVPINPFGEGNISDAARQYLTVTSTAEGKITQFNTQAYVAGDTSGFFNLPGGPVAFSLGGEYRRETNYYDLDDYTQAGYAFYNAIPTFESPAFEVKEAFGELRIPLLKDIPLIQELTATGSARVSDYKGATGTVWAYGGNLEWAPFRDFRFRGSYNRSVRAPNLSELYSSQSQNFAPAPGDPCSARNLATGSANRVANCNAAGRPQDYDFVYTSSLEIVSGGNPNLRQETSDSYTAGFVFTPSFIPGLSITADYYNITVNDVITATGSAQQILNLCYDSPTLNNPFCGLFQRAGAGGGPRGEQAFRVLEGSLLQSTANFAKLKASGVDTNISYRRRFGWGELNVTGIWTRTIQRSNFTNPADPTFENVILGELADPKNQVNLNTSVKLGNVTLGYQFRWIDKMYLNTFEDYNGVNGLPPQNTDFAPIQQYPSVSYSDIRLDIDATEKFNVYLGVDNMFNKQPPYGLTGVGEGSGIFDVRGRYFYAGFRAKF